MYLNSSAGSPLRGAELQQLTTPGYSYGYYEARIMTQTSGWRVVSFFWIEQPNYGSHSLSPDSNMHSHVNLTSP